MKAKSLFNYFSKFEISLWSISVIFIVSSFLIFDRSNYLALIASLLGVSSLMFYAKGNPLGNILMIVFCALYGYISYTFAYYGEMLTYVCMSGPMAIYALISWLKNPYKNNKAEVKVNSVKGKEIIFMLGLSFAVTVIFYFILKFFGTANLLISTFSITTSFIAVYLTARRSPFYALAYALNDVVLIILWTLATLTDITYVSVIICFVVFLANDIYGFCAWQKMKKRQEKGL